MSEPDQTPAGYCQVCRAANDDAQKAGHLEEWPAAVQSRDRCQKSTAEAPHQPCLECFLLSAAPVVDLSLMFAYRDSLVFFSPEKWPVGSLNCCSPIPPSPSVMAGGAGCTTKQPYALGTPSHIICSNLRAIQQGIYRAIVFRPILNTRGRDVREAVTTLLLISTFRLRIAGGYQPDPLSASKRTPVYRRTLNPLIFSQLHGICKCALLLFSLFTRHPFIMVDVLL